MHKNSNKNAAFIKLQGATKMFIKLSVDGTDVCSIKLVCDVKTVRQRGPRLTRTYTETPTEARLPPREGTERIRSTVQQAHGVKYHHLY